MNSPQVSIGRPTPKAVEFKRVVETAPTRIVVSIDGQPKEGKTRFCLTAPAPIAVHNFNFGMEGTVDEFVKTGKEIYQFDYAIPMSTRLPGSGLTALADPAARVWEEFVTNFRESLKKMRTCVVDMGGEAWETVRLARLGKLTQVLAHQYTSVNAEFRQLIQLGLDQSTCNVIFTHKVKEQYKDDKKTGMFERAGFGDIGYDMQTILRTGRDLSKTGVDQFSIRIEECRANFGATGQKVTGEDCTFSKIATIIYPTTTEEFWK